MTSRSQKKTVFWEDADFYIFDKTRGYDWIPDKEGYVLISAGATHANGYTSIANEETMVKVSP